MTDAPAILVVGGDSLVGAALAAHFRARGDQVIETSRRPERIAAGALALDLAADPSTWPDLPPLRGAALCAAVARLQDCERDPAGSRRINVEGTAALALRLVDAGVPTVFLSSDKVFDGSRPYRRRDDPICPDSAYGGQKADAEAAMPTATAILRLSKVVSPTLDLFQGWTRDLRAGRPITPFDDLMMAPVPVERVVDLMARLIDERRSGLFQLSGAKDVNYVEAARILALRLGAGLDLVRPRPSGGPTARHTTLEMSTEQGLWGLEPPDAEVTLGDLARRLAAL